MFDNLVKILESFLGDSEGYGDQIQFNCPACAEDEEVDSDGKHNLEICLTRGVFRCWKCEHTNDMSGKLYKLIKKYGSVEILERYKEEIKNIRSSKEYELNFENDELKFEDDIELSVKLPDKCFNFTFDGNKKEEKALIYLKSRGFTETIIKRYDLMYTNWECPYWNFKNRIIIPSYDKFKELNYYTGRDYVGKSSRKYYNMENSNRKNLIFNERFINWDGDVVLVEGPIDHLVVPNSIPLLGKVINKDFYLFNELLKSSTQNVIIFLDDDAEYDAKVICNRLSYYGLCGRLKVVPTRKLLEILKSDGENIEKLDPGELYKRKGHRGISWAIKNAEEYN